MWKPAALCTLLALPAAAQDALPPFELDGNFAYGARQTIDDSDNDIMRFTLGGTWRFDGDRTQARAALEAGARNEDFSSSYPAMFGGELSWTWNSTWGRQSVGGRVRWADDRETTGELAYVIERFGSNIDLRGMVGVQGVSDAGELDDRDDSSAFGLAEATWFPTANIAFWLGIMGDSDGDIGAIGAEYRPSDWPVSFFLEWGHTLVEYRGFEGYNDLYGGLRYVPRSRTLQEHRRAVTDRSFLRYVEVQ